MSDPAVLETAARAVQRGSDYVLSNETAQRIATAVLAAVTPLIRTADVKLIEENVADLVTMTKAAALERAAQVADDFVAMESDPGEDIAALIRALKDQP